MIKAINLLHLSLSEVRLEVDWVKKNKKVPSPNYTRSRV